MNKRRTLLYNCRRKWRIAMDLKYDPSVGNSISKFFTNAFATLRVCDLSAWLKRNKRHKSDSDSGALSTRGMQPFLAFILLLGFLIAMLFRLPYTYNVGHPYADPRRHTALIRNIRNIAGFMFFADQSDICYSPARYYFVALITEHEGVKWVSEVIGSATVLLYSLYLSRYCENSAKTMLAGGMLTVGFGHIPLCQNSCRLCAEAFSMLQSDCAKLLGTYFQKTRDGFFSGILSGKSVTGFDLNGYTV